MAGKEIDFGFGVKVKKKKKKSKLFGKIDDFEIINKMIGSKK